MDIFADWRDIFGVSTVVVWAALGAGIVFGWLGERSDYCARTAYDELLTAAKTATNRPNQVWQVAIASLTALFGVKIATILGWIDVSDAPLNGVPIYGVGLFIGAILFGVGMGLSRGCISRLVVLTGRGNVRAMITLVFTALFAWASISGLLAVPRVYLGGLGEIPSAADLSGTLMFGWITLLGGAIAFAIKRGGPDRIVARTSMAAAIGLLVPACLFITSTLGADDFEPVTIESLRFTAPIADSLNYLVYSTAFTPKFGVGLIVGAILGAAASSALAGRRKIEGFNNAPHPLRYIAGAFLMGFGGVIASGCTVGWLLSGASVMNGGVLIAFIGFGVGNYLLRLPVICNALGGETAASGV
jgi:uncharacterized membrane protein YedE/YeeE